LTKKINLLSERVWMPKNAVIYFKQNLVQADRFLLTYQRRRSKIKSGGMKIKLDIPFLSTEVFRLKVSFYKNVYDINFSVLVKQ